MASNNENEGKARTRWWEDYLVRYFTGMVVGTFCVFILVVEIFYGGDVAPLGKRMLFSSEKDSAWLGLIILALTGAAYCYLASTAITVLHAGRMIRAGMHRFARKAWYIWWAIYLLIFVGAALDFWLRIEFPGRRSLGFLLLLGAAGPVAWLFFGQIVTLILLKIDQGDPSNPKSEFIAFYRKLVLARDAAAATGIRDSYSHLREHANSVFITVIELSMLAVFILAWKAVEDIQLFSLLSLAFVLLWISPNVLLWGLANSLEADLANNPGAYQNKTEKG